MIIVLYTEVKISIHVSTQECLEINKFLVLLLILPSKIHLASLELNYVVAIVKQFSSSKRSPKQISKPVPL